MSTLLAYLALIGGTVLLGPVVLLAQLLGVKRTRHGIYEKCARWWSRGVLAAAGVEVITHRSTLIAPDRPHVYIANHVSWFDILVIIESLPDFGFVAKREVERVPIFGSAARAVGVMYIDRENRKAAFSTYDDAAKLIREGDSVVVYPEGTRGDDYALRPFKKGPFVLAIQAGVPVIPIVIHGTIAVNARGSLQARSGTVHVHLLDPISTEGLTYDQRDELAERVRSRMADVLREQYGVNPPLLGKTEVPQQPPSVRVTA